MTPFLAFILGVLVGWLLQWLLEVLFFRSKTLDWQRRASDAEAALAASRKEQEALSAQVAELQAELAQRQSPPPAAPIAGR